MQVTQTVEACDGRAAAMTGFCRVPNLTPPAPGIPSPFRLLPVGLLALLFVLMVLHEVADGILSAPPRHTCAESESVGLREQGCGLVLAPSPHKTKKTTCPRTTSIPGTFMTMSTTPSSPALWTLNML